MNWNQLESIDQIVDIDVESHQHPVMIFKHSTTCSISAAALSRVTRNWLDADSEAIKPYYLDLLAHRSVSNFVAEHYNIQHQSPQVLVIKDGHCIYHTSHMDIRYEDIKELA